jgi:hypothetical protein
MVQYVHLGGELALLEKRRRKGGPAGGEVAE